MKLKLLFFLFLIALTGDSLFRVIIAVNNYVTCAFSYIYAYVCLYISEMNDNNIGDEKEELGLFCYSKVLILSIKWYSVI